MNKLALDNLDRRLLNAVQSNNLLTAEQLSAHVPLSPSAITRRIRRLRDRGIIARDIALLAPEFTDQLLRAVVTVQYRDHSNGESIEHLKKALISDPRVQLCFEISGEFDLLVVIAATDMTHYNTFTQSLLTAHSAVSRFVSNFVRSDLKNAPCFILDELRSDGSIALAD